LARRRWLHLPGRTVRVRLTALYGGLFLVSGACLLSHHLRARRRATDHHRIPDIGGFERQSQTGPGGPPSPVRCAARACPRARRRRCDVFWTVRSGSGSSHPSGGVRSLPSVTSVTSLRASRASRASRAFRGHEPAKRDERHEREWSDWPGGMSSQLRANSSSVSRQLCRPPTSCMRSSLCGIALAIMAVSRSGLVIVAGGPSADPGDDSNAAYFRRKPARAPRRPGPYRRAQGPWRPIDDLLARLETAFEAQKALRSQASHELRTPLHDDADSVDVASASLNPAEVRVLAGKVGEGSTRLTGSWKACSSCTGAAGRIGRPDCGMLPDLVAFAIAADQAEITGKSLTVENQLLPQR